MDEIIVRPSIVQDRGLWPPARLLLVPLALGLWCHWRFQMEAPMIFTALKGLIVVTIGVGFCLAYISSVLARLYGTAILLPFYAMTVINEYLYDGLYWTVRTILRLLYMRRVSAFIALLGELGFFIGLWELAGFLMRRYWL